RGGALLGQVGPHLANDRVHRVVGTSGVDGEPTDAPHLDPVSELASWARVLDEVARFVWLARTAGGRPVCWVETVVSRVNHQDVAALDADAGLLLPALEVFWAVDLVVAETHLLQIDYARPSDQQSDWQLADAPRIGDEVVGSIQVSANVQGRGDLHPAYTLEGDSFDPLDRWPVVAGEAGRVGIPVLRQVDHVQTERHGEIDTTLCAC